jgi:hypothetical protein
MQICKPIQYPLKVSYISYIFELQVLIRQMPNIECVSVFINNLYASYLSIFDVDGKTCNAKLHNINFEGMQDTSYETAARMVTKRCLGNGASFLRADRVQKLQVSKVYIICKTAV